MWIVGLIERSSNMIIMYSVEFILMDGQDTTTLTWFRYFTVVHKYCYKQRYIDTTTGEVITVHTHRIHGIEGAWNHTKGYSKTMNGSKTSNPILPMSS